eukprot:scaffold1328_cov394-Prasinococcus_capsulatus_cf.AAC.40
MKERYPWATQIQLVSVFLCWLAAWSDSTFGAAWFLRVAPQVRLPEMCSKPTTGSSDVRSVYIGRGAGHALAVRPYDRHRRARVRRRVPPQASL